MRISVVIPVFNDVRVARALDSVLAQRHGHELEIIVVDAGSTDGTLAVVDGYRDRLGIVVSERDLGIYDGMNKGIRLATGDIIGVLGADDYYCGESVLKDAADVVEVAGADGCYGDLVYCDRKGNSLRHWKTGTVQRWKWYLGWQLPHQTMFVRRDVYERFGLYDLDFPIAADYEFGLRTVFGEGIRLEYIGRVLVRMTVGGYSNRSVGQILRAKAEVRRACRKVGIRGGIWISYAKPAGKLVQYVRALSGGHPVAG